MRTTVLVITLLSAAFLLNSPLQLHAAEENVEECYELPAMGSGYLGLPNIPCERTFVKIKRKDVGHFLQCCYVPLLIYKAALSRKNHDSEGEPSDSNEFIRFQFDAGFVEQENGSELSGLYEEQYYSFSGQYKSLVFVFVLILS